MPPGQTPAPSDPREEGEAPLRRRRARIGRGMTRPMPRPPAVVLLSGGLDSATVLAIARRDGFAPYALSFRYGQRHALELAAAGRVAQALGRREARRRDDRPRPLRRLGPHRRPRGPEGPSGGRDGPRHPDHLRPRAQHRIPLLRARVGGGARGRSTSSSASTRSTTAATPTAVPSTSPRSRRWRTSPPAPASRGRAASASARRSSR